MHKRTLIVVFAALLCAVLSVSVFAADTDANKDAKFDQDAALMKFWNAPDDAVVGTVNGINITKRELLKTLWFWQAPSALQDMLTKKMIEQAADKADVNVTSSELYGKAGENIKRTGMSMSQYLAQVRLTKQRFLSGTKLNMMAEKCVQKQIQIPDSEYDQWIKARHILIRFPEDEKDEAKKDQAAKTKIDEIAAKLKAGEDFAKLADEYSQDPGNDVDGKKKGGDLGWFTRGRQVPEFEKAAFALKPGEVSEPVKTFYGYHLIKLDKVGKDATPQEKAELRQMILETKIPQEIGKWFSDLQSNSKMDNKLMQQPETPKPVVRPPAGRMTPPPPAPKPAINAPKPPANEEPDNLPPPPPPPAE